MTDMVCAVVVTHRRPDDLAKSLDVLTTQTRMVDHLIVVDNDFSPTDDGRVRDLVAGQPVPAVIRERRARQPSRTRRRASQSNHSM